MICLLPLLFACIPDDWNGQPYTGPGTGAPAGDSGLLPVGDGIEGNWLSQGADLSELLANEPFNYVRVDAMFEANGDYSVIGEDADGETYPLSGTWTTVAGTPGTITLTQTEPYDATAFGIWQVDGSVLTYEVVQTAPDYGFQPPSAGAGFGSSTGPGLSPGVNVQTYRVAP